AADAADEASGRQRRLAHAPWPVRRGENFRMSKRRTLADWLSYIEGLHPRTIELGLERVARVRDALALRFGGPIVMVGGTNGKGSTCAMLESILACEGYRVGLYTSPHLLRYNERVHVDRSEATDERLAEAFERVEAARGDVAL